MKRILVPYDFSKIADHAVDFAIEVADRMKAEEVLLLNVIEHPSESRLKYMGATPADPMENVYFTRLIQLSKGRLEQKIDSLPKISTKIYYKIQLGSPYNTLSQEVAEEEVELVVMATGGLDGVDELFFDSNAEKVVRTAKCPVISLKSKVSLQSIKNLVFASHFVNLNDNFVNKVLELQNLLNAQLRIVKINTPANFTTNRHDKKQMSDFVNKYNVTNYTMDIYNYTNEEDGIILYADDISADMIAIGTSQRSGFNHFLVGSIAEDVVNHSKRPVWTMYFGN